MKFRRMALGWRAKSIVLLFFGALACSESVQGPVAPPGDVPAGILVLQAVGPTQFQTRFVEPDTFRLRSRVLGPDGAPLQSVPVEYSVVEGSGALSATRTITDDQGFTVVTFVPTSAGRVVVEAVAGQGQSVSTTTFEFLVIEDPVVSQFRKISGDNQTGIVGSLLGEPMVVRILDSADQPVDGFPVVFAVDSPDSVSAVLDPLTGEEASQVRVLTDENGFAQAFMRLGASPADYSATATAAIEIDGTIPRARFSAVASLPRQAAVELFAISGERQTVILGTVDSLDPTVFTPFENPEDPNPLVVQALDRFGNPVPGVEILWFVTDGTGTLALQRTFTDDSGISINVVSDVSLGRNLVDAVAATTNRVTFVIEGVTTTEPEAPRPPPDQSGPPKGDSG